MSRSVARSLLVALVALATTAACGSDGGAAPSSQPTNAERETAVIGGLHDLFLGEIDTLLAEGKAMEEGLPVPAGRGWDATLDADALGKEKQAWFRARSAYERIEGAIAPLFPDVDRRIDARYDDFLAELGAAGDPDPFDGEGVTGMHALERIFWADLIPARVVAFESSLVGYGVAAFPSTEAEAAELKTGLAAALVTDVTALRDGWKPVDIHPFIALQGLSSLMNEQREKVRKASTNEEESRYAERTMVDLRDNLAGTRAAFALFEPWLASKTERGDAGLTGPEIDADVQAGFSSLDAAYGAVDGDALPLPPPTWSSEQPTAEDLATPFGKLFSAVDAAVDPNDPSSVVSRMRDAAAILGYPFPG